MVHVCNHGVQIAPFLTQRDVAIKTLPIAYKPSLQIGQPCHTAAGSVSASSCCRWVVPDMYIKIPHQMYGEHTAQYISVQDTGHLAAVIAPSSTQLQKFPLMQAE